MKKIMEQCVACGRPIYAGEEYLETYSGFPCHRTMECLMTATKADEPFEFEPDEPSCLGCGERISAGEQVVLVEDGEGTPFLCHYKLECLIEGLYAQEMLEGEEEE